jgi:glucose-1-phosphate thymidylyltransferase
LGDGSKWGIKLTYILQEKPLGLANIFQVCEDYLKGDSFVMHLGDNIFVNGIKDQIDYFNKVKPSALAVIKKHPENTRMGVPYFDKKGKLVRYVEKPQNPPNDFA